MKRGVWAGLWAGLLLIGIGVISVGQERVRLGAPARAALDRRIAAQFAPVFQQGLGDEPRGDYITNFDSSEKDRPLGEWFFDPAATVKRHFNLGDEFAVVYLHNPYLKTPGAAAQK